MKNTRVSVITVVHGERWNLLQQVTDACLKDEKVTKLIIVDNGCKDKDKMDAYLAPYGERIKILRQEKNIGYSGAISKGMEYARTTECDFVFVLDDDSIPQEGAIDIFLNHLKLFPNKKVVLIGFRENIKGMENYFYKKDLVTTETNGTIFDILTFKKFLSLAKRFTAIKSNTRGPFLPIVPAEAFVTGGSFLPIEAVREAALPDARLFIYGEDLEFSWNVKRLGYSAYLCHSPKIYDIDITFAGTGASHITGLFKKEVLPYKVYFRMRNSVIISRRNTVQSKPILFLNIIVWYLGLFFIGFILCGFTKIYYSRVKLITQAVWHGYFPFKPIPQTVKTP